MPLPRATITWLIAVCCAASLVGDLAAATPKQRIAQKEAKAKAVLEQVNQLDRRFEASVEDWNGAKLQLAGTRQELSVEQRQLRVAERERRLAMARVRARLVALYESNDDPTALGILLGSTTLSDMLDRLDAAHQIAQADHRLAVQTTRARDRYATLASRTSELEREQAATVTRLGSEHQQIGAMLSERQRLLSSVRSEVAKLQAEEALRQARLAAEARARLAREAVLRAREAARAKAAAEAAAKKAAAAAVVPTPAAPTTTAAADPPPAPVTTAPVPAPGTTTELSPSPPAPSPTASLGAGHPEAAQIALQYLGVPYLWGGASPDGFDCSGLVMYVYAQLGISLPHFAAAQFGFGTPVPRDALEPGDLVFFDGLDHVGIYIGGGQMVHAPQTGDVVKITAISDFGDRYVGARRL